jgi:hypothetical protein
LPRGTFFRKGLCVPQKMRFRVRIRNRAL